MQQLEWSIPTSVWSGLNTKYDPSTKMVGPDEFIAGSANYDLNEAGNITKRAKTTIYNPTPLSFPIKDEYEMIFQSGTRHKLVMSNGSLYYTTGNGVFTSAASGFVASANMEFAAQNNRVYFGNGIDRPQVYDIGTSYGGVTYTPPTVAAAGVTAPSTNLTAAAPSAGGSVPDGAHTYKYTFLYYDSEESNGSAVSGVQTCGAGNNTIALSSIDVGGVGVTARKIYRDNNDGVWVLIATLANNTATTFNDTIAVGTTPIPDDNNIPPLWSLVVHFRDRLWVAGVAATQSKLYYSDAGFPDVWPVNNFITCNEKDVITAVTTFNDKVVVFGKSSFGIILGSTSDDFRYLDVSPNLGCVDNRSIQIVTIRGVPKLQWLSQFGVYQWDGSNIQLISDKVENLLQFNIQQAQGSFNKNIQDSAEDFAAGTVTPGINLSSVPGSITTDGYMKAGDTSTLITNPTKQWDTQEEWEGGSSLTNIATQDGTNTAKAVLSFYPLIANNTLSNLQVSGSPTSPSSSVHTPTVSNNTGENHVGGSQQATSNQAISYRIAQPITLSRAGTLNTISLQAIAQFDGIVGDTIRLMVWNDASGVPGSAVYTGTYQSTPGLTLNTFTASPNIALGTGRFWFGAEAKATSPNVSVALQCRTDIYFTQSLTTRPTLSANGGGWTNFNKISTATPALSLPAAFTFTQNASSASGSMTTAIFDTLSQSTFNPVFSQVISIPSLTRVVSTVYASNDPLMLTGVVTQVLDSDILGISPFTNTTITAGNGKRYWKIVSVLTSSDDRFSSTATRASLNFFGNSTWISEVIDHTSDIVSLDDLLTSVTVPSGTSVTIEIATSADNLSYTAYGPIGSAIAKRYSKIRAILATNIAGDTSPTVSLIRLNWTVTSTFISSAVTTIVTPVQWGIFQTDFDSNGGTVAFYTRSAATEGGLGVASWTAVTNGQIIPSALNIWVQWRVIITSHVNQVPEVRSVILNWLNVTNTGIRVASLFYNQVYYLAAAEFNQTTNNIVLYYDREGRWGQYRNLNINTMGTFYGKAYYGDALVGNYINWLDPTLMSSQVIETEVRTKAYSDELVSSDKTKALRHVVVSCEDTQATITPFYSIDNGLNWLPMVDVVTGLTFFTGSGTTRHMKIRFVPTSGTIKWGYSIIIRLYNNDQYPLNIVSMRAKAYISDRQVVTR